MRRKEASFVGADDRLQYQCGAKVANEFDALIARRPVDCSARQPLPLGRAVIRWERNLGGAMKKPLTMPEEAQPRNITRADLVLTDGFGLEVDGRMKAIFPTRQAAEKKARALKSEFPMLQIEVYDAAEKTRTRVELLADKAIPIEEGS